jgi:hypothetical protein
MASSPIEVVPADGDSKMDDRRSCDLVVKLVEDRRDSTEADRPDQELVLKETVACALDDV